MTRDYYRGALSVLVNAAKTLSHSNQDHFRLFGWISSTVVTEIIFRINDQPEKVLFIDIEKFAYDLINYCNQAGNKKNLKDWFDKVDELFSKL